MGKKLTYNIIANYINDEKTGNGCKILISEEEFYLQKIKQNKSNAKVQFKIQCGCINKNIFETTFDKFKNRNKKQCNICSGCEKLTIDVMTDRLKSQEISIISKVITKGKSLDFKCHKCNHFFTMTWYNLIKYGCPNCNKMIKDNKFMSTISNKQEDLKIINPNIIILSDKYIGLKSNLICKCLICCCEFEKSWKYLQQGVGCPECSKQIKRAKKILSLDYVINKIKNINKDVLILNQPYVNAIKKLKCECLLCHTVFKKSYKHLLMGVGCPECNKRLGERLIRNYLINNLIEYIEQYKFKDCKNKRCLPFDFYLPEFNILIEFDGIQHSKSVQFFGGEEKFKQQQINDDIKNKYCVSNNIKLIRIPYFKIKDITIILDEELIKKG